MHRKCASSQIIFNKMKIWGLNFINETNSNAVINDRICKGCILWCKSCWIWCQSVLFDGFLLCDLKGAAFFTLSFLKYDFFAFKLYIDICILIMWYAIRNEAHKEPLHPPILFAFLNFCYGFFFVIGMVLLIWSILEYDPLDVKE